ncbi:FIG071646: Sugar transferase [hydrothermal vent metagenome]|uniref:FIG071646: Sugar transferase n=1 Tax=hydrothermal vent metagenome TaxID=652676 RepID=A0A3B0ZHB5_9ZZZZ
MDSIRIFKHYVRIPFILLGIGEFIVMCLSISASAYIIFQQDKYQFANYFDSSFVSALIYAFVMSLSMVAIGLYQARLREGILGFLLRLSAALFLGTVMLSLIFYISPSLFLGRGVLLLAEVISFIGIALIRNIIYFSGSTIFKKRILVMGAGERAASITELRRKSDQVGFTIVGYVHVRGEKNVVDDEKVIHLNSSLLDYCIDNNIDEIVLAINDRRKTFPMSELLDCKMSGVDMVDILQFFERETSKIKLDHLHPSYLLFSDGFQQGIARQNVKRLFDVVISGLFLLVTWPIMALTALLILLESGFGQPILYRQVRVGEDGKPFQVLKFRSMRTDAEKDGKAQWAVKNDTRITKVGGFIRKARIDELPQIFNVFKGDMSFVGPRPERPEFVGELSDKIPYFSERHRIKPGITGWAQLSYPYGSSEKDSLEKLQYDLYYVKNHSLFLDFLILLQTVEVILFSKGAR